MAARIVVILALLLFAPGFSRQQQLDSSGGILNSKLSLEYPHGKSELVFLLDRSGSIGPRDFAVQLLFVKSLLTEFSIGDQATRVAIVSYSDDVTRHIDYIAGESGNKCSFLSAMEGVKYVDGSSTDIARALREARDIFASSRADVKKVLILLSDGVHTGADPLAEAQELEADKVEIFTIGVGLVDETQLQMIARSRERYFAYHSFNDFERLALRVRGDPHETMYDDSVNQTLCDSLCQEPFPNANYGCCDLDANCTCSLVGGRHACVCGPGRYGRNGFLYQCKLCPRGTYKSTYEPADRCTPCPSESTTDYEGSTTLGHCDCKDGYEGNLLQGESCRLKTCATLTAPSNGQIIPRDCDNKYKSVCSFQCELGYELVDPASAKRQCASDGNWTETTPQCRKVQCAGFTRPSNGDVKCHNQEVGGLNVFGTVCGFSCDRGYNPVGSRQRTCTETGEWSGKDFTCKAITCSLLPPLGHGNIGPTKCTTKRQPVKSVCIFKCNEGFRLEGPPFKQCEASGNWSHPEEKVACIDDVPPVILCPDSIVKEADPGLSSAEVSWAMPTVSDNLDGTDALTVDVNPSGMKSPHQFEIGSIVVTYTATDTAGRSSGCVFKVIIEDTQPPTVESCPDEIIDINSSTKTTSVSWPEPKFADNSNQELDITQSHMPDTELTWGTHIVTYTATDAAGLSAVCQFTIRIGPSECPNHPDPLNGARVCDQWLFGQFCRVFCNQAYEFAQRPAAWYICAQGSWKTQPTEMPVPWPDCSERSGPNGVRLAMESQYYAGDCINPKTQRAIKAAFVEDFKTSIFAMSGGCLKQNACEVEYVTVYCGEINEELRRRRRRSAGSGAGEEFSNIVTLDFTVSTRIRAPDKAQHESQFAKAQQTLEEISGEYERLTETGEMQLTVNNEILPVVEGSFSASQKIPLCREGSMLVDNTKCLNCAVGSYLDTRAQVCKVCEEGTYQDQEGQDHCKPCGWNEWTNGTQAKDASECRPVCNPGTYSPSGLATCRPCRRGTFQPDFKQKSCLPCRQGTTTPVKGSRSFSDCQAVCRPGTFSATGLRPCQPCPLGSYQPEQEQRQCTQCTGSQTTTVEGATSADQCRGINACASAPCQNGAQCVNSGGTFHCRCEPGYTGTTCDLEIDECVSQPCFFNATCIDRVGGFECNCMPGYEGALCEVETNECLSDPCQNEGKCQDQIAGFDCDCVDGFWGPLCENPPDYCAGQVCSNRGICIPVSGSFRCVCPSGFQGVHCETDLNECDSQPCENGGSCTNTPGSYRCACVPGFEGTHCEENIDECLHHSCKNGSTCLDVIDGYQCLCPSGVKGKLCETEMSQEFLLSFTTSTTSEFSFVQTRHSEFQAITVAMWLRSTDSTNIGTPISYAAERPSNISASDSTLVDNALTVTDCAYLKIYVNGRPVFTDTALNNGWWNNLVFTWSMADGEWYVYLNGSQTANGLGVSAGEAIPGQGAFVLGQEQDSIGGSFSSRETYIGDIYKLNIWDRALEEDDIRDLASDCSNYKGNVVAWSDFQAGLEGGLVPKPTNSTEEMPDCGWN